MNKQIINKIKASPKLPGVYIFSNRKEIVYIGKATNLNQRLKSYLDDKLLKNKTIAQYANHLDWRITQNDIEALLLESKLIKKHLPRVNVILKDNKNYFFIHITADHFPKVFITHNQQVKTGTLIGPFTSGTHLKMLLKLLRPIFPFCTCKNNHKKLCLNSQINLCPGFCCLQSPTILKADRLAYLNNIKHLIDFLTLPNKKFLTKLYARVDVLVRHQNFEQAQVVKQQILAINNIVKHNKFVKANDNNHQESLAELSKIFNTATRIKKIEMYDVSNIAGKFATASLVFFDEGNPNKQAYKKFKIRYTDLSPNDTLMLKEIFKRRVNNPHWQNPDLILIDGGVAQLNTAIAIFTNHQSFKDVLLGSMAKGKKQLLVSTNQGTKYIFLKDLSNDLKNLLVAIQNESHRFAVEYHHQLYRQQLKNGQ